MSKGSFAIGLSPAPTPRGRRPGDLEVWSKMFVRDGVEIHLEPQMAGMSPERVLEFCRRVMALTNQLSGGVL